jgi:hypothetical protein
VVSLINVWSGEPLLSQKSWQEYEHIFIIVEHQADSAITQFEFCHCKVFNFIYSADGTHACPYIRILYHKVSTSDSNLRINPPNLPHNSSEQPTMQHTIPPNTTPLPSNDQDHYSIPDDDLWSDTSSTTSLNGKVITDKMDEDNDLHTHELAVHSSLKAQNGNPN